MFLLKDSRGKPSLTFTLIVPPYCLVLAKFAIGGLTLGSLGTFPVMSGGELAAALGAIFALWWGREKTEKQP